MFTAVFFVIVETRGNSDILQQVKVLTNCGTSLCDTTWQKTSNHSNRPINTYNNMDESPDTYSE